MKKKPIKAKWCVTAINRLTRQREAVTLPCAKDTASSMRAQLLRSRPGKRVYIYPLVEVYQTSWI